jgi:hypothetical protein
MRLDCDSHMLMVKLVRVGTTAPRTYLLLFEEKDFVM